MDGVNRILMIDDDPELCALIQRAVSREGMAIDICFDGWTGLAKLRETGYQLVILDVMMSGADGFEVLSEIRKESGVPVLMLTAKNDSVSKVRGLRGGADDYLTKPFDLEELMARILSLIRRYTRLNHGETMPPPLRFEGLTIDTELRTVMTATGSVELPPKEFDLLLFAAENQGRILTKRQIYEAVWKDTYVYDDSNIMSVISRLRKKIEDDPGNPKYLQTVKGIGYRFSKDV